MTWRPARRERRLGTPNRRLEKTNGGLDNWRDDVTGAISELRRTVLRVAKISDETLSVSLEDTGRMEVLEGRLRTLEAQMAELRARQ